MSSLLTVENVTVQFGGLVAVDKVSLTIAEGEIRGLIGPNGAGKTTLFNAISGLAPTRSGRMIFAGADVTALGAPDRAARGIRRTFQTVQLVQSMTVFENLLLGLHSRADNPLAALFVGHAVNARGATDPMATITRVLDYLDLAPRVDHLVSTLSIAEQRYVEIGQALVASPRLLMLDEPTAGLSPAQVARLDDLIARLPADWNVSIVLVEHVIPLVVKLCHRITVLDRGRVIAEGTGEQIENDPAVQEAYLGERLNA
ncbi:ABC transporter ATP-binding protein [Ancylobacter vacuolatus]|uniref:Branched-chain amino acid transport system ATP-binding protein n=1 Tax=Ancylobacter vacuolatus TaxID=223389 RepID=A0ABU0DE64_9HYPH|nr:ABC transporter ATP-binding protein [Ancylobacter vacuolatus]MDQ0346715.1 branched-chain amino acid transport system ATP-binding protein [Ancylobacter vacuolatus]